MSWVSKASVINGQNFVAKSWTKFVMIITLGQYFGRTQEQFVDTQSVIVGSAVGDAMQVQDGETLKIYINLKSQN